MSKQLTDKSSIGPIATDQSKRDVRSEQEKRNELSLCTRSWEMDSPLFTEFSKRAEVGRLSYKLNNARLTILVRLRAVQGFLSRYGVFPSTLHGLSNFLAYALSLALGAAFASTLLYIWMR